MTTPRNLTLRQMLEGMTLAFDPAAAKGLNATIQFEITEPKPDTYHLRIADGDCTFHLGGADDPDLTIATPADVWLRISRGELDGQEALTRGLYQVNGDLSLMLRMDDLFKSEEKMSYQAPPDQRPGGPIPIPGMAWMTVAFLPWMIHWITFDLPGVGPWVSVGLPFLLSLLIVGYRLAFDRPTLLEIGGLGFFTLAGALTLMADVGFATWGSVISQVVMGVLWLGSLVLSDMPLCGEYSKWGHTKKLWRTSLFIHPNAAISLAWGWQFLVAALIGAAAVLLPHLEGVLTTVRYLLLAPTFVFTFVYQRGVENRRIADVDQALARMCFWARMGLSAASGMLLVAAMPGFDVNLLGWLALVPLLLALNTAPLAQHHFLALPFGLIWSLAAHNYYPHVFSPALGIFLILAVGAFYAGLIQWGMAVQERLSGALKLLALPVTWAAVEFVKFVAPVVREWWFAMLAKSVWRFPPALQILSVTGFPGLSFLVMLANATLAFLLLRARGKAEASVVPAWATLSGLVGVTLVIVWGAVTIPAPPAETFTVAATVDMANQDPAVQSKGEFGQATSGYLANTPAMSQAIFDVNAGLTRQIAEREPAFVVWPETEFASADDARFMDQLKKLAKKMDTYIVADVVWQAQTGMHDTALMVGPDGREVGRRAKIHITGGEEAVGFTAGPQEFPVYETPYGEVGLGVCYDYHYLDVVRSLARSGADVMLMPTDDDFGGNAWFPPYHASDAVFRAAEHRVAFATGAANGVAIVVDPYGRIVAESDINRCEVVVGEVFTVPGQTLYTRLAEWSASDWFGWLTVAALAALVAGSAIRRDSKT